MKYLFITTLLITLFIVSIIISGCNPPAQPTAEPTVTSTVEEPVKEVPTEPAEETNSLKIPSAEKIDGALKTKVDEQVEIITTSSDDDEKRKALDELEKICKENPSDFALFAYLMQNPESDITHTGLSALEDCYVGEMTEEKKAEEFEILSCALKHPVDSVREAIVTPMAIVSDTDERKEKEKEILRENLDDPSSHVRVSVIQRLGQAQDKESIKRFKEMLDSNEPPEVKGMLMLTLERLGADDTNKLMELADKGEPYVRAYAIEVLARKKHKELIPKLIEMLDDKTETTISGKYEDEKVIVYTARGSTIQQTAIYGLESITGEKFESKDAKDTDGIVQQWKEWAEKNKDK